MRVQGLALKQNWLFLAYSSPKSDWGGKFIIAADPEATTASKNGVATPDSRSQILLGITRRCCLKKAVCLWSALQRTHPRDASVRPSRISSLEIRGRRSKRVPPHQHRRNAPQHGLGETLQNAVHASMREYECV